MFGEPGACSAGYTASHLKCFQIVLLGFFWRHLFVHLGRVHYRVLGSAGAGGVYFVEQSCVGVHIVRFGGRMHA